MLRSPDPMRTPDPDYLVVGHLNKAHGTKGDLFVWPLTSDAESVFRQGSRLWLADEDDTRPDPAIPPLRVDEARPFKRGYLVRFAGVTDRNRAEELAGLYVLKPFEEIAPLDEGEIFYHQLLGLRVVTAEGRDVGEVVEVFELEPAHLLEVAGDSGTRLLPFTKELVRAIDLEAGRLVIDPPEGLLDL